MSFCINLLSLLLLPSVLSQTISVTPSVPMVGATVTVDCTGDLTSDLVWSFSSNQGPFINLTEISSIQLSNSSTDANKTLTWSIVFEIANAGTYRCHTNPSTFTDTLLTTGILYRENLNKVDVEVYQYEPSFDIRCRFLSAPAGLDLTATWCFQPYIFPYVDETRCISLSNNSEILAITPTQNLTASNIYTSAVRLTGVIASNAGFYRCVLSNGKSNMTEGVRVRVREQLEPLWPAIGIIIQFIIVAICIVVHFIWDSYKDKQKRLKIQEKEEQNLLVASRAENLIENDQQSNEHLIKVAPT